MSEDKLICDNCGKRACPLVGGECIHKCSEAVPKEDLEALVEEWREEAADAPMSLTGPSRRPWAIRLEKCADELAEVLEDG